MTESKLKIISLFFFIFCTIATSEDLRPPHRYFEIGFAPSIGASNNVFSLFNFLQKNVVIDLEKIAANTPKSGFVINANIDMPLFFMNLNLKNGFHLGMNTGIEGSLFTSIGKSFIDALGYGIDSKLDIAGNINGDFFAYSGITSAFKLKNKMRFSIAPSIVLPLIHIETNEFYASINSLSSGNFSVLVNGGLGVYSSLIDTSKISKGGLSTSAFEFDELMQNMGFDLGLGFEMPFPNYDKVQIGGYTRIPIVPGTLKYNYNANVDMTYGGTLANIFAGNTSSSSAKTDFYENSGIANFKISRPMRFGAEAAYRPFGSWFTVSALLGFGIKYPLSNKFIFYPEYEIGVGVQAKNTVGASISSAYLNQIFKQELNLMLNAKVLELITTFSMQSENLLKSFIGTGFGFKFYFSIGVPMKRAYEPYVKKEPPSSFIMVPSKEIPAENQNDTIHDAPDDKKISEPPIIIIPEENIPRSDAEDSLENKPENHEESSQNKKIENNQVIIFE